MASSLATSLVVFQQYRPQYITNPARGTAANSTQTFATKKIPTERSTFFSASNISQKPRKRHFIHESGVLGYAVGDSPRWIRGEEMKQCPNDSFEHLSVKIS